MIKEIIKKILISIISVFIITTSACAVDGTYTTNGYFYLPAYGAYGTAEFNEYNAYMQIADTQIEANKIALTDEGIQDLVGAMWTGNTETFLVLTYQDIDGTIDAVVPVKDEDDMASNSATHLATQQSIKKYVDDYAGQLTEEEVEDYVGGMLSGIETFITVDYQDATNNVDFVVPVKDEDNMVSDSATHLATQQSIKKYVDDTTGYTDLTSFVEQTAWRVFYSNTDGNVTELALGADGTYLGSNGATSAPTFTAPSGAGDMLKAVYDTDQDGDIDVSSGGTEKTSWTQYCIPYLSGAQVFGEIPIGTDNYALTVNGSTGYDWTNLQVYDAALTSVSGLIYVSPSFIKLTANDTYAVRTIAETITDLALDSDNLSDVSSIAMLDEAEIITGNWVNTTHPWADNEVANDITINLATLATTFTATDNENEALACPIVFVDGATGAQGAETDDTDFTYTPSTGNLSATQFESIVAANLVDKSAAETITGNWVNTNNPWADNEVSDDITITIADTTDTTSFPLLAETITGAQKVKSDAGLTYDAGTGMLGATNVFFGKFDATAAPAAATDDITLGYVVGSIWIDVTNDDVYTCLDNTDGAAVWSTVGGISFLNLTDTPAAYESGKYAKSTASGIIWDTTLGVDTYGTPVDNDFAKFTDLNTIEGRSYSEVRTDLGLVIGTNVLAEQTVGIANDNLVEMDSETATDNDFGKFTANGLEGRSYSETRQDLSNYIVYPQDYATGAGTVGDPWAGDCIRDAYTACPTGGTIYMRAGYYTAPAADSIVDIGKSINIIGEGIGKTFLVSTDYHAIYIGDAASSYVTLKGFTLDCSAQTDDTSAYGIVIVESSYLQVIDLEIKDCGRYGIAVGNKNNYSLFQNLWIHGCYTVGMHPGTNTSGWNKYNTYRNLYLYDNGSAGMSDVGNQVLSDEDLYNVYDNIHAWGNGAAGIQIMDMRGGTISNCTAYNNTGVGFSLGYLKDFNITNCVSIGNTYGFYIGADSNTINMNNCSASFNSEMGIEIYQSEYVNINNCLLTLNDKHGLWLDTVDNANITNVIARNNNRDDSTHGGISIDNSTNTRLTSCQSYDLRTLTGIDIAFVDGGAGEDTITMTDAKFIKEGILAGETITVSGSTSNDGDYTVVSVVAATINVATASLTAEAAGDTVTITQEKMQDYGLKAIGSTDYIELINCNFEGNLVSNILNSASATIISNSVVSGNLRIGDGLWTNYVKVTDAGAMTLEGTANIEGVNATEMGYLSTVSSNVQTQLGTKGDMNDLVDDTSPDLGGELDAGAHSIGFTQQSTTGDGTTTIDWKLGNKFKFTFGAQNDTFTFTAPTNPCNILLMLIQDGTGSRTATFPGTVKWAGGTAPTLTTGANTIDICSFYWDGTNYFGVASLAFATP